MRKNKKLLQEKSNVTDPHHEGSKDRDARQTSRERATSGDPQTPRMQVFKETDGTYTITYAAD